MHCEPCSPALSGRVSGHLGTGTVGDYHTIRAGSRHVTADRFVGGEDYHECGEQRGQA